MTEQDLLDGLGTLGEDELDLSSLMPALPQRTPPRPPAQQNGRPGAVAMLASALPLILGGRAGGAGAAAAVLRGFQKAQARRHELAQDRYTQQRQAFQDQRTLDVDAQNAAYRQNVLTAQDRQRQALQQRSEAARQDALMKELAAALDKAESPEAIDALTSFYGARLPALSERIGAFAAPFKAPTRVNRKRAEKQIATLEKTYGQDWAVKLGHATHVLPGAEVDPATGQPRGISTQELLAMAGTNVQGLPQKPKSAVRESVREGMVPDGKGGTKLGWVAWNPETGTMEPVESPTSPVPPRPAATGARDLTPTARANVIQSRRSAWTKFTKAITDRQASVAKLQSGLDALKRGNRSAATQTIITTYNKLLDETSVVREGEYARSEQLVPLMSRIEGAIQRITLGGASMRDSDLIALAEEAKAVSRSLESISDAAAANLRHGIEEELADYGIPASRVFGGSVVGRRAPAGPVDDPTASAREKYRAQQGGR